MLSKSSTFESHCLLSWCMVRAACHSTHHQLLTAAAMASLSSLVALSGAPLATAHPSPQLRHRARASPLVPCSALPPAKPLQCREGEGLGKRVGGVLLPLFAAALIGSAPVLEAVVAPRAAIAEVETDNLDAYKDLLQKIKERRGRQGLQGQPPATAPAPAAQPQQPSVSPAAARLKEAAEKARQEREAESIRSEKLEAEKREAEKREAESRRARETAASIAEREKAAAVEKVAREKAGVASVTIKKKTHGFLPLFVSQFFLLLATLGVGAVLFVVPEKQLKEIQDKVDDFVDKATPVAEDAYSKAKPLAEQAWAKAQEAGVAAKPYVEKAWEQAKPMAAKAVEASKPLLKEAQVKASELLQEAQKKAK